MRQLKDIAVKKKADLVWIEFKDTGSGILKDNKEKIFQPFFSTKKSGTGLGLTLAKNIVLAHGGDIWFKKNNQQGATFVVTIPMYKKQDG